MYLQGLEGSWLDHPFWRTKFLIRSEEQLQKLRDSGVGECWIDLAKGEDVATGLAEAAPAQAEAETELATADAGAEATAGAGAASFSLAAPAEAMAADAANPPTLDESQTPNPAEPAAPAPPELPAKAGFSEELERAAGIRERAGEVVAALLELASQGMPLDAEQCLPVLQEISESMARNPGALVGLMRLKRHDEYRTMHAVAVSVLMVSLARELTLDDQACVNAGLAGLLLDVGKATLPDELVNKPGALSDDEWTVMKTHPQRGHALLKQSAGVTPEALDVCLRHHERVDGSGYPDGLAGAKISELARMSAICDVYDALTSNRPYKHPWDPAEAIAYMASCKGPFDPAIFSAFVRCLGIYPTGSLVRLQSERLAVVLEQNPGAMSEPVVRVFFCTKTKQRISPARLDLASSGHEDYIVGRESAANWPVGNTEALWSHGYAAKILGAGALAGRATLSGTIRP